MPDSSWSFSNNDVFLALSLVLFPLIFKFARNIVLALPEVGGQQANNLEHEQGNEQGTNTVEDEKEVDEVKESAEDKPKTIMQPENTNLLPPKDDPFTLAELQEFDGSDPSKPIYVAIKGTIFDVTAKREMYGPGKSYNIFAGKDGSKGLGKSSLKTEDAIPDYSDLPDNERKTLDEWHTFFTKRYNIVGKVVDLPEAVQRLNDASSESIEQL